MAHQAFFRSWLMDEENENWIFIVNDLCVKTELKNLLPSSVAWGKIIFTSRRNKLFLPWPVIKLHMPPLFSKDGLNLFWSRGRLNTNFSILEKSKTSPLFFIIEDFRDEPAVIVFAVFCVTSNISTAVAQELGIMKEESSLSAPNWKSKTLKWVFITIEHLSLTEIFILSLFFLFDCRKIFE